jgi:hypothetical protein
MDANLPQHRYRPGQLVSARLHDWTADGKPRACVQVVRVVGLIHQPFGYNVESLESVYFRSHMPYPIGIEHPLVQEVNGSVSFHPFFIRETDLEEIQNPLLRKLRQFTSNLIFREITVVYTKPPGQIQYINYFAKDGTVSTIDDERKLAKEPDTNGRFAYKVAHFFGFAKPLPGPSFESVETRDVSIHFSMNRFSEIDFWNGMRWGNVDKNKAYRPEKGDIICGYASRGKDPNAPSFDQWFVCSPQFRTLCSILHAEDGERNRDAIIPHLILPENPNHYYIAHEIPFSRHLYAAIFCLVNGMTKLPVEWKLPERKASTDLHTESFEVWWPARAKQ